MANIKIILEIENKIKYEINGELLSKRLIFNKSDKICINNQRAYDQNLNHLYSKLLEHKKNYQISDVCNILIDEARNFQDKKTKIEIILDGEK